MGFYGPMFQQYTAINSASLNRKCECELCLTSKKSYPCNVSHQKKCPYTFFSIVKKKKLLMDRIIKDTIF